MQQIIDEAGLEQAFQAPLFLLFKHSPICPSSARAWLEVTAFLEAHPDLASGWIDVRDGRPLSLAVAQRTGVEHESPQALLLQGGQVLWHASHYHVQTDDLDQAFQAAR